MSAVAPRKWHPRVHIARFDEARERERERAERVPGTPGKTRVQGIPEPRAFSLHNIIMRNYFPGTQKSWFWGVWTAPGPQKPLQKVGGEDPHLLEWFLWPPGPSRPPTSMISGSRKIGFQDYLNTKLGLCVISKRGLADGAARRLDFRSSNGLHGSGGVPTCLPLRHESGILECTSHVLMKRERERESRESPGHSR